mgnify:FL=1
MKAFKNKCLYLLVLLLVISCAKDEEDLTGSIYGKVTDTQSGEVLHGATVTLTPGGISRTTGDDGTYEFLNLEPGQYQVEARKADYVTNTKSVSVVTGKNAMGDITLTPVKKDAKIELGASTLNFGKTNTSLSFDIFNKGTAKFNWNISGLDKVDWLEVNPASGALEAGKSCAVQVSLLREKLTENKELTIIINADKESVSLKITAEVERKTSKIEIIPSKLDFGTDESVLTFDVKNIGNSGGVSWNITGLDVDWITSITPMKGETEQGKSSAVKVALNRSKIKDHVKTSILINADGESLPLEISADEKLERRIEADPATLALGEQEKSTLTLRSYYGSTSYMLIIKENDTDWLKLSKTNGTIPQYDAANPAMKETVELSVSREGLQAGDYNCTLIVRSDLQDLEIPVTMKVKESDKKLDVSPRAIDFGQDLNSSTFAIKNIGNTGTLDWNISGINADWITVSPAEGALGMGKSATVTVTLDRSKVKGQMGTTIKVNVAGLSEEITISAEEKPQRSFDVNPQSLTVGVNDKASFSVSSYYGTTFYQLSTKENVAWISFSKNSGTVAASATDNVEVRIDRKGLAAGNYSCNIVVQTDLGNKEIPLTMIVEKKDASKVVSNGLYVYYTFEGNTKSVTETTLTASALNAPTYISNSKNGSQAISFSRANESYISIPEGLIDKYKFSISFWAKGLSDGHIFHSVKSTNENNFCLSMVDGKLKFTVTKYFNGYPSYDKSTPFEHSALDNDWHMITLTSDYPKTSDATITSKLYIDGEYVGVATEYCNPFSQGNSSQADYGYGVKFQLGGTMKRNSTTTLNALSMSIDNLRVYDTRVLSASEVKEIYEAEKQN